MSNRARAWSYWWGRVVFLGAIYRCEQAQATAIWKLVTNELFDNYSLEEEWKAEADWTWFTWPTYREIRTPLHTKLANVDLPENALVIIAQLRDIRSWTLYVLRSQQQVFSLECDFSLLHPRQFKDEYIKTLAKAYEGALEDYIEDYELNLPEETLLSLQDLPFTEVHLRCMSFYRELWRSQAHELGLLLQEHGISCNATDIASIVTGENLQPQELEWYVGNLPRLLSAIGLNNVFDEWEEVLKGLPSRYS